MVFVPQSDSLLEKGFLLTKLRGGAVTAVQLCQGKEVPVKFKQTAVYRGFQVTELCASHGKWSFLPAIHHSDSNACLTVCLISGIELHRILLYILFSRSWFLEFGRHEKHLVLGLSLGTYQIVSFIQSLKGHGSQERILPHETWTTVRASSLPWLHDLQQIFS